MPESILANYAVVADHDKDYFGHLADGGVVMPKTSQILLLQHLLQRYRSVVGRLKLR
jgi:hypothetical protein